MLEVEIKKVHLIRMISDDFSKEHEIIGEFWTEFSNDYEQKDSVKQTTVKKIIDLIKVI